MTLELKRRTPRGRFRWAVNDRENAARLCHALFCAGVETIERYLYRDLDGGIEWRYAIKRMSQDTNPSAP